MLSHAPDQVSTRKLKRQLEKTEDMLKLAVAPPRNASGNFCYNTLQITVCLEQYRQAAVVSDSWSDLTTPIVACYNLQSAICNCTSARIARRCRRSPYAMFSGSRSRPAQPSPLVRPAWPTR